ncbi:MAG: LytR C-terminal domain-containing protein [bacterium]|nr:LytR C-terminal domain-containing protein [bacterium]
MNSSWTCLIGSYHHTCTEWVNGAGQTVACDVAECNPLATELGCSKPSTISVLVANGTDVSGAAGRLSRELNAANYVTLPRAMRVPRRARPSTFGPGTD